MNFEVNSEVNFTEKDFTNYDDAVTFIVHELDRLSDLEPEGAFSVDLRYVNLGWQVAIWIDNEEEGW